MQISWDNMYPFGNVSTHSVETSSKESEKIQSYFTKKIKIKIISDENSLSWKTWIHNPEIRKPELDMNCFSSRKNEQRNCFR